ncbi:glycoside hydrolase family 88 protein [Flavobacterium sp. DGU99]|uniref:Glycoside hydrolase family 88 protein n=2 Tax=Flavobacterium flavipallidum TaxID=3139140 RepID=A0ABU9HI47_9FLAO
MRVKQFLFTFILIGALGLTSCKSQSNATSTTKDLTSSKLKWSEKMALTLMMRHPKAFQIDDRTTAKWDYVHGLVASSIEELYKKTKDEKYYEYVKGYADALIDENGKIATYEMDKYNIDMVVAATILFDIYDRTKENKYLVAMQTIRKQLDNQPRTASGGFWHKQIYPNQMWLDGLYMGQPFYAQYTTTFENGKYLDDVAKQFELLEKNDKDPKTGLLYHAWDESRKMPWADKVTGKSPNFWSRALGWYAMALVDVLDNFPKEHPKQKELVGYLNELAVALEKVQDKKTGLWYQVTDMAGREGNYLEASGSSMFAYALAKGVNKGYLPAKFKKVANFAFDGLTTKLIRVDADGGITLTQCCQVAGLGGTPYRDGSYEYYVNEKKKDNDPKATGPFILAAIELNR